jgi:3-oxoacyl-ACP reductase-like protein
VGTPTALPDLLSAFLALEAVLLTSFVLIRQNAIDERSERRNHLELQINLLAEKEANSILEKLDAIAERFGIDLSQATETTELAKDMGSAVAQVRTDDGTRELDGRPVPEPSAERSAGPISPGRGSMLQDKVAIVTGAARGIGRAIAVEMAANGADVVAIDIAGTVSSASNAVPATPEELDETVRMIKGFGRRSEG